MERVQFEQEQMLPELKDLQEKGIFSEEEIKQVVKKRTQYERALIRRIPHKSDFLRYIEYEMGLERLRRKRVERLKIQGSPSVSDYALVRRQYRLFERGLRKFGDDVGLWVAYMEVAEKEGANGLAQRISARAIKRHPGTPGLYVHAARLMTGSGARKMLQRGLRMNKEDAWLWGEYVRFEVGFVEKMRRRWGVLGIEEEEEEEEGRREVMRGGIVMAVMDEAVKVVPKTKLMKALEQVLRSCETPIQDRLLEYLEKL